MRSPALEILSHLLLVQLAVWEMKEIWFGKIRANEAIMLITTDSFCFISFFSLSRDLATRHHFTEIPLGTYAMRAIFLNFPHIQYKEIQMGSVASHL